MWATLEMCSADAECVIQSNEVSQDGTQSTQLYRGILI